MATKRLGMKRSSTTKLGVVGVLSRYFGKRDDQSVSEFGAEIKTLTGDERLELARDAAQTMGLTESEVQFSLRRAQ